MEKIAIIILTFNSAKYLAETIECCKNQSYKNIEIIIVDDASTDGTQDFLNSLDDVSLFFNETNKGISKNLNFAVNQTDAEYIIFLGHDDSLPYTHVEKMLQEIKSDPQIALVHCNSLKIDADGRILALSKDNLEQCRRSNKSMYHLAIDNFIQSCGLIFDRKKYIQIGGWDESYKLYGEYLSYIKFAQRWKIHYCDKTHGYYRVHTGSMMHMINREQKNEIKAYKQLCRNLAMTFLEKNERDLSLILKRGYRFAKENFNYK